MNTPAHNKQLMHYVFAELAEGNSQPFVASMADDFSWTIAGSTTWARTWEGKDAVLNDLFGLLRDRLVAPIKIKPHRLIADDDYVVVEARGDNVTRDGGGYDNTYCYVIRMADRKMASLTEYADTALMGAALGDPALAA
jgi:ketosteroid isomerase-like protein